MKKIFLFLIGIAFISCSNPGYNLLEGKWIAVKVEEQGDSLKIEPSVIQFEFEQESKQYTFQSTLNYLEAGDYYLESNFLYTSDTLKEASRQKVVEILQLNEDSLIIRMMEADQKERIIKLVPAS